MAWSKMSFADLLLFAGLLTSSVFGQTTLSKPIETSCEYSTAPAEVLARAERGNAECQFILGSMYEHGTGVAENPSQAAIWYRKSAESGHLDGQYDLAELYLFGAKGVPRNREAAFKLFGDGAQKGHGPSQFQLGAMFADGTAPVRSYRTAFMWLSKAAENEGAGQFIQSDAHYALGTLYYEGRGVPQDYIRAYMSFSLAAAWRFEETRLTEAIKSREMVAEKMTAEQIAEAQRLATEWASKRGW